MCWIHWERWKEKLIRLERKEQTQTAKMCEKKLDKTKQNEIIIGDKFDSFWLVNPILFIIPFWIVCQFRLMRELKMKKGYWKTHTFNVN